MQTTTTTGLLRLGGTDLDSLPWQDVRGCPGVKAKELWQSSGGVDALISYGPGATTPGHPHLSADHHIWIIEGQAEIAGQAMSSGSYVYVPPGAAHPIEVGGQAGCVLLQIHRPR
jgi:mannose-6-phosphate isomerase-like protein (cupin superfamily)